MEFLDTDSLVDIYNLESESRWSKTSTVRVPTIPCVHILMHRKDDSNGGRETLGVPPEMIHTHKTGAVD